MRKILAKLTQERLKEILNYNELSGILIWKEVHYKGIEINNIAGTLHSSGYLIVNIDRIAYRAHRLIWFYVYGTWPIDKIDHKDSVKSNNILTNLRDVTSKGNSQNLRKCKNTNSLGVLGVCRSRNNFTSSITVDNKKLHLGTFKTIEEAHQAYLFAKRELHITCTI